MKLHHLTALSLLGCWFVASLAPTNANAEPPIVAQIRIEGNQRVEKDTILFHITQEADEPLDNDAVRGDIRFIYEMGFFSSVSTKIEDINGEPSAGLHGKRTA
jgi:outer membrane protein insertion porin family